ncbi:uncharacterized protein SPSC_05065 [Sporisorium scitamineum]|nr:uncharacterized protein SPSC_05065 [Sporisorium scitamineum]
MLQSNTDSSSFKLQPAPRPKSKKRPQNPPPLVTPAANTSSSTLCQNEVGSAADSDSTSLRSCFEGDEDEAITPKASLFNVPLLPDRVSKQDAPTTSPSPPHRPRSSTISFASITSSKTSSSVTRLLAAMSTSPRRSSAVPTQSPSATVPLMLTDRSPTPSTPLFPRRTLMRSLSSTCVSKSPTSPSGTLRKRMGWRGERSAQKYEETAIIMSPGSPLTPRRAKALHTPTQASIAAVIAESNEQGGGEMEPLSATLKALGAKRRTERFTAVPVQSPLTDVFERHIDSEGTVNGDEFELVTATRKIFHLPTWVRFEANHHARTRVAQENRQAALEYAALRRKYVEQEEKVGELLPKTSQLGDGAPSSPNGDLLSGFDLDAPSQVSQVHKEAAAREGDYVVSVVRRPTMAALREMDGKGSGGAGKGNVLVGAIRSAWPPFRPQRRIKPQLQGQPKALLLAASSDTVVQEKDRRDGWGGVLTRSSWFPSQVKGPLVSPDSSAKTKGFKTMFLQPSSRSTEHKRGKQLMDDEWEDVDEPSSGKPSAQQSFLELHDAPRFFNRPPPPTTRPWFPALFSSRSAATSQHTLDTFHTLPLKPIRTPTQASQEISSQLISKGTSSVENRPLRRRRLTKTRVAIVAITLILVLAVVANIVIIAHAHSAPRQQGGANATIVGTYDPLVGKLGSTSSDQARQSIIAKAAQLSQP